MAFGYIFGVGTHRADEARSKAVSEGKSSVEADRLARLAYDGHVETCMVAVNLHNKMLKGIMKILG